MLLLMLLLDVYLTIQKQSDQVYLPLRIKLDCFVRTCGIEPHRGKFLSACHYFSGLPFLYQMRNIYGRKQSYHLHVHRGMQDATSGIFKPYLFATFFRLYYFPFCAPPSSDCTLPNFGFITTCRISQCRRTRTTTDRTKICCATITPYIVLPHRCEAHKH